MNSVALKLMMSNFGMGGSRRMANKYPDIIQITDDTDYDFYCSDTESNRAYLLSLGFEKVEANNRQYWDDLLLDIYTHPSENVECLIRSDRELYTKSFESIDGQTFYKFLWKSAPHQIDTDRQVLRAGICHFFNELFNKTKQNEEYDDIIPF